jgi:heptosyltransferase-3
MSSANASSGRGSAPYVHGAEPIEPPFGRVMVAKTTHMGDLIISLPMAAALKRRDPACTVVFLTSAGNTDLARACPAVDEVVTMPANQAMLPALLASLRLNIFIQVNNWRLLALAAHVAAIPVRIGSLFRLFNWWRCTHLVAIARASSGLNKRELDLQYLAPLSIAVPDLSTIVRDGQLAAPPPASVYAGAGQAVLFRRMARGRHAIVLCPGGVTACRHRWPPQAYAALISQLDRRRYHWFICGLAAEREQLQGLLRSQTGAPNVTDLVGRLPLADYMRFVGSCDGLIGGSCGPVHLAAALGIRTLGLYQSRPADIGRWRPLGNRVTVLHSDVKCEGERGRTGRWWVRRRRPAGTAAGGAYRAGGTDSAAVAGITGAGPDAGNDAGADAWPWAAHAAGASGKPMADGREAAVSSMAPGATAGGVTVDGMAGGIPAEKGFTGSLTPDACPCILAITPSIVAAEVSKWFDTENMREESATGANTDTGIRIITTGR